MPGPLLGGGGRKRARRIVAAPSPVPRIAHNTDCLPLAADRALPARVLRAALADALTGLRLAVMAATEEDPGATVSGTGQGLPDRWLDDAIRRAEQISSMLASLAAGVPSPGRCTFDWRTVLQESIARLAPQRRPVTTAPPDPAAADCAESLLLELTRRFVNGASRLHRPPGRWMVVASPRPRGWRLAARSQAWTTSPSQMAVLAGTRDTNILDVGNIDVEAWDLAVAAHLARSIGGGAGVGRLPNRRRQFWLEVPGGLSSGS